MIERHGLRSLVADSKSIECIRFYDSNGVWLTPTLTLSNASAGPLQDAWHYATLILNRHDSTFNGDRSFPCGIRGQMRAYESLLAKIDHMTTDNETWELVRARFWEPETFDDIVQNTKVILQAVNLAAARLGIDARTGESKAGAQ